MRALFILALAILFTSGCGLKGPLYLPEPEGGQTLACHSCR